MLPDRLAGCSGPACKSAQPIAELAKVGQKFSANQLAGIFRIRLYRTPIRLTYASPPPLAYARYGGFASVRLLGEQRGTKERLAREYVSGWSACFVV